MKRYKWNEQKIRKAVANYAAGYSIKDIAKVIGVSGSNVSQVLKQQGVWKSVRKPKLSDKELVAITSMYRNGKPIKFIAEQFNRNEIVLGDMLRKTFGKRKRVYSGKRKYTVNEHYFDQIDNEERAYWLGFLAADGSIRLKKSIGVVSLSLQGRDVGTLEQFKVAIQSQHPLHKQIKRTKAKEYVSYGIYIGSMIMARKLTEIGLVPNKTFCLNWAKIIANIPNELVRHFIRGYSNGDGCWYRNTKSELSWCLISGSKKFLVGVKKHLRNFIGMSDVKIHRKTEKAYCLQWGGNLQLSSLYKYLYQDSCVFMRRKQIKACPIGLA